MLNFVLPDFYPAAPEIFLLVMASVILLVDLFVKGSKRTLTFLLTQATLVGCLVLTFQHTDLRPVYTFSNMFVSDLLGDVLKLLLYLTVFVVLAYSWRYIAERPEMAKGEFYVLTLFATLGMMVMISANNFVTIYLGLEMLSLAVYAMVAMNRTSVQATEAAMKYFVLGALASGLLLYGMSMVYGATGSLEITRIADAIHSGAVNKVILVFGLVFLVSGLGFKLGVVPFHMWLPDVYHGAPTPVSMFLGSAPKLAAFAMAIRLLVNGMIWMVNDWQQMLIIMAVLSMAIGNLAAIAQTNIKRMLGYSAISHMGFMLLGLVSGGAGVVFGDPVYVVNAYSSAMFYVVTYVVMSLGAFGVILLLSREGFEADKLEDFKGLNKRSPLFAAVMMMIMFSMAGIPFFVGFFAKFSVFEAVISAGYLWLAIAGILFSLIGAFYYLRVVKIMYFEAPTDEAPLAASWGMKSLLAVNGLAVAAFGLFPQDLMSVCVYSIAASISM